MKTCWSSMKHYEMIYVRCVESASVRLEWDKDRRHLAILFSSFRKMKTCGKMTITVISASNKYNSFRKGLQDELRSLWKQKPMNISGACEMLCHVRGGKIIIFLNDNQLINLYFRHFFKFIHFRIEREHVMAEVFWFVEDISE